jgi:hypothetical protein
MEITNTFKKECGSCTKCCEGPLNANINGYMIGKGKPCPLVIIGKGCGDYKNRPEDPCRVYKCAWLTVPDMPEEFKPNISGVITQFAKKNNISYFEMVNSYNNPSAEFLSWAFRYCNMNGYNILWTIDKEAYYFGSREFVEMMNFEISQKTTKQ